MDGDLTLFDSLPKTKKNQKRKQRREKQGYDFFRNRPIIQVSDEEGNFPSTIPNANLYDNGEYLVDKISCITDSSKFNVTFKGYDGKYIEPKENVVNAPTLANIGIDNFNSSKYYFL